MLALRQGFIIMALLVGSWVAAAGTEAGTGELLAIAGPVESLAAVELTAEPLPVDPTRKHQLTFHAKMEGDRTLETNDRIRITNDPSSSRIRLEYYDSNMQPLPEDRVELRVLSRNWYRYGHVFYPPAAARSLRLQLIPGDQATVSVKALSLTTALVGEEAVALNPHPTFEYGDLSGYGYQSGNGGGFYTRPDGTTVWNSGFCGVTPRFRVAADRYYQVTCAGTNSRSSKAAVFVQCFKAGAQRPFKTMQIAVSEDGRTTDLLIPAETESVNLLCYFTIFAKIVVTQRTSTMPKENGP